MNGDDGRRPEARDEFAEADDATDDVLMVGREVVQVFSHRLRSMLTSVGAAADYALKADVESGTHTEMLGIIAEQANRIEGLLDDFLVLVDDPPEQRSAAGIVDLYHVAREVVRELAPEANSMGTWLVLDNVGGTSTVYGERSMLRQVVVGSLRAMLNLTRPGDRVISRIRHVSETTTSASVELVVTVESQTNRGADGHIAIDPVDLSLDAVRRICEHHCGTFSVMDKCPGVICRLPAAPIEEGPITVADGTTPAIGEVCCIAE